jgi:hypothetical protein
MQEFRIFRALGLSFKAWFHNFIPFTLLTAVLYAPVVIWLATYDASNITDVEALADAYFGRPIYVLIGLSTLLAPMITYRVIQDLNGQKVSMLTSMKFGMRGILPAVMFTIVSLLLQKVPGGVIVNCVMTCLWFVAMPAAVAERLGPFAAFARSSQLTSGRRWGIFGMMLLIALMAGVLLFAWIIPRARDAAQSADVAEYFAHLSIWFTLAIGVFHMFQGIVEAVAYALLRRDKDGVSYEELARIFD